MEETECMRASKLMKVFPEEGVSKLMPAKEVRAISAERGTERV